MSTPWTRGSRYAVLALGLLAVADSFQGYALFVLGPEISTSLGISRETLAAIAAAKTLALTAAVFPFAMLVQRKARRAALSIANGIVWSVLTAVTGLVTSTVGLSASLIADGATTGSAQALHRPLLADYVPTSLRVRALAWYQSFDAAGNVAAPLLVAVLAGAFDLTWRGIFIVLGAISLLVALVSVGLRDPGLGGKHEGQRPDGGMNRLSPVPSTADFKFGEAIGHLLAIRTVRRVLAGYAVLGVMLVPLNTYLFFFLDERWALGVEGRGLFLACTAAVSAVAVVFVGRRGDRHVEDAPHRLVTMSSTLMLIGVAGLLVAVAAPVFPLVFVGMATALASFVSLNPLLSSALYALVPPPIRPHVAALSGIAFAAVGGFGGILLLQGVDRRFGVAGALAAVALPGLIAVVVLGRARASIGIDIDRQVRNLQEQLAIEERRRSGLPVALLECGSISLSFGGTPVLRSIDLTVRRGEVVALVGTNGAGKTTLLRTVAGSLRPDDGSIRLDGCDITHVSAAERVRLGIVTIHGGRGVFDRLTLDENLAVFARRSELSHSQVRDLTFSTFPSLASLRSTKVWSLSGGQRQMLAMSRALILEPKVLCVDELSLGLAPAVVGQLLEVVTATARRGTGVVLVEQSLNIALDVSDRLVYLDRGSPRFDGSPVEFAERRDDVVRAVFFGQAMGRGAATSAGVPIDHGRPGISSEAPTTVLGAPTYRDGNPTFR